MATQSENARFQSVDDRLGRLELRVDEIIVPTLTKISVKLDADTYVTKDEYRELTILVKDLSKITKNTPLVEKLVFSLVGFILLAVLGAIVALVVAKPM